MTAAWWIASSMFVVFTLTLTWAALNSTASREQAWIESMRRYEEES